jgi:hypothetical protein
VFFGDVAQQVLLAQQSGLQAFSLGAFERMHVRAESGIAAMGNAIASKTEVRIRFSTIYLNSTVEAGRLPND